MADPDVRDGTIGPAELVSRHLRQVRPESCGGIKVEAFMEIEPNVKAALIHCEELPQPLAEEVHDASVAVGELDRSIPLGALTGVQRNASGQERLLAQDPDPDDPLVVKRRDLLGLPPLAWVWPVARSCSALRGRELHVPHPQRD
ncbi:MAG TPA: hypothetical protein VNA57_07405 [Acidimicrobiales bacterium]|nr:hypothetical protein [Acidimicrobiales bacterium]